MNSGCRRNDKYRICLSLTLYSVKEIMAELEPLINANKRKWFIPDYALEFINQFRPNRIRFHNRN